MKLDKEAIVKNFSKYASSYDEHACVQGRAGRMLAESLPDGNISNILEIGCGTGDYTAILRKRFPASRITAVDISAAMIDAARQKTGNENTDFIIADAECMDFNCKYDLITSNAAFQWLDDPGEVIERSAAALSTEGRLVFSSFGPKTFCELKVSLSAATNKDVSIASDLFPDRIMLEEILKKRFENVRISEKVLKERYDSLERLFQKIKYSGTRGAGAGIRKVWSPDLLKKIEDRYVERFGAVEATYQIFFCSAECGMKRCL